MKKIVRQQNYLKELIEAQNNHFISKQSLKCVLRSLLIPLLDNPEEAVVLYRIYDTAGVLGILKRLEFSNIEAYNFSDEAGFLKEKVWANTEFLCVLTHRFVAIFIWDSKTDNPRTVRYYSIFNSKMQNEALDIIDRNVTVNLKEFQEKFKPDRRDNILLNSSIRAIFENLDEASKDAVLGFAEFQSEKQEEEYSQNIREVAHEIKNQLSICDLYTEIIKKYCLKNNIKEETISNSLKNIDRAVKLASSSLANLKTSEKIQIKPAKLKEVIESVSDLTKIYFEGKNIEYIVENECNIKIPIDENKFSAVLVNIIKNAIEAFENNNVLEGKYIKLSTEEKEDFVVIKVRNNANKIKNPEKIFVTGYSTKSYGNGLGLGICKKSLEEMYGKLELTHTDDNYTEFAISIAKLN